MPIVIGFVTRVTRVTKQRSHPRLKKIKEGEGDKYAPSQFTTIQRAPCVDGLLLQRPDAILGPKRLGYNAGISCHGTQMFGYIQELDGVSGPVCIIWAIGTTERRPKC